MLNLFFGKNAFRKEAEQHVFSRLRFEMAGAECADAFAGIPAFICVDQIVGFDEDLIVQSVDHIECVMMRDEKGDAVNNVCVERKFFKQSAYERSAFLFLQRCGCAAVFLAAQRAGNVVRERSDFKDQLRFGIETFQFADGLGIRPHLEQMSGIMARSAGIGDHAVCDGCDDGHGKAPPRHDDAMIVSQKERIVHFGKNAVHQKIMRLHLLFICKVVY